MTDQKQLNTGVKHTVGGKNYTIYIDKTLKNPLAGFFIEIGDKKKKIKLTDLNVEKADKLRSVLKNAAKPPPGKKVNPLTGRFIKIGGAVNLKLTPKTFQDPISLETVKKTDGIELNRTWYDKKGLRYWINSGKETIPHSRRAFTEPEITRIFTSKNGQRILRKKDVLRNNGSNNNNSNNNNSNNNYESIEDEYRNTTDLYEIEKDGNKTFSTFADFKAYVEGLEDEMTTREIGQIIGENIKITDRPGYDIKMTALARVRLRNTRDNSYFLKTWFELYFKITKDGEITQFGEDVFVRDYNERGNRGPVKVSPAKLIRAVDKATKNTQN